MATAPSTATARCEFGLCDGSGFVIDELTATARDCRCRALRIAATRARALEARIPKRYRAISFEHSDVIEMQRRFPTQVREIRAFVADIDANLDAGRGLWLTGSFGTGKTALAMIVSKAAIDAGRTVAIYSCPRLLERDPRVDRQPARGGSAAACSTSSTGSPPPTSCTSTTSAPSTAPSGCSSSCTRSSTPATRTSARRSSPRTSSRDELAEQLGERIVSRLEGMCGEPLPFWGADARRVAYPPRRRRRRAPPGPPTIAQ